MCCSAFFALFPLLCAHMNSSMRLQTQQGRNCVLFLLGSPKSNKMSEYQQMLGSVIHDNERETYLGLKSNGYSNRLSGSFVTQAPGQRSVESGNRAHLRFRRSLSKALLWFAPEQVLHP